ncbi:uncharacterized protein UTRI_10416 [Ustilago trichophora]|uniref:SGNH hydrolase-type esterase domain-containing protein n=1 Tax=Ustilago trichophora TaxID=86804 RepID=A0A5C3EDR2_9BASI|nr:uncharacterized protein UTRI_10416 [Ustilago trichophora]
MRLISLGSSFAAGPGIAPQIDSDAGRSSNNYPNYFARKLGLDPTDPSQFLDLTVSSATLLNLISEPQDTGKKVYPPQVDLLPPLPAGDDGSDVIVTITGGGNDMFYIGSMFAYTLKHTLWGKILSYLVQTPEEKERLDHPTIATPDEISWRFTTLLDKIQEKYPKATIYLVEYFAMMGPNTIGGRHVAWDQQQVQRYMETADLLQRLYEKASQGRSRVHVVPLAEESKQRHALGSMQPWVSDGSLWNFYKGGAFHPNETGMKAASEILFDFHTKLNPIKALQ